MAWRIRRRARARGLGRYFRGKAIGFVFLGLVPVLMAIGYMILSITPDFYIYVHNTSLGAGTSLPTGATGISAKFPVAVLFWVLGALAFISGVRRIGVRM